jgi:hypothetical protein
MSNEELTEYVKERNEAIIEAIKNDKWDKMRKYSQKYGVPMPNNRKTMKAGTYKAAQYIIGIPEEIKVLAMQKCLEIGFNPFIKPIEEERGDEE